MYNLIVGDTGEGVGAHVGVYGRDRMLEHTDPLIRQYMTTSPHASGLSAGGLDGPEPSRLLNLPTLLMPELGFADCRQVGRVGRLEYLQVVGGEYRFRFLPNLGVPEISTATIEAAAVDLGITNRFEFSRTHWAVKDVDLYGSIGSIAGGRPGPKVFQLPPEGPKSDLVAVMMPFDAKSSPVYAALRQAVADAGMRCERADDIWEEDAIMQDIANLIARSRVVISDLSGKNPNVFYETGIAHTLGRDVIQITQSAEDVPFDLRHLRFINYLANGEGLEELKLQVTRRLKALVTKA